MGNTNIIFLADIATYPFSRPLSLIADALLRCGHTILMTHCTGQFSRCPIMDGNHLPSNISLEQKKIFCTTCTKTLEILQQRYHFSTLPLSHFFSEQDRIAIATLVESWTGDYLNFTYKQHALGKIAFYNLSISTKDSRKKFNTPERLALFKIYIRATVEAFIMTERIIALHKPESFIFYEIYYYQNGAIKACQDANTPYYNTLASLFMGINMGQLQIWEKDQILQWQGYYPLWKKVRELPLPTQAVQDCWDDVYFRNYSQGTHIYSPVKSMDPGTLYTSLHINPEHQLLVAYTSSLDEFNAMLTLSEAMDVHWQCKDVFTDQIEWITALFNFVKQNKKTELVVRIHPRMGVEKRSGIASPELMAFRKAFSIVPERCHIIWPEEAVSSYDLAELADVALVAWSTMGGELSRIGVPVIASTHNLYYIDDDYIRVPLDKKSYFSTLQELLHTPYSLCTLLRAIRFFHFYTIMNALDFQDSVAAEVIFNPLHDVPIPHISNAKLRIVEGVFQGKYKPMDINLRQLEASVTEQSPFLERQSVLCGIGHYLESLYRPPTHKSYILKILKEENERRKRIVHVLSKKRTFHLPRPGWEERTLRVANSFSQHEQFLEDTQQDKKLRILAVVDNHTRYYYHGIYATRTSRLVARLAQVLRVHTEKEKIDETGTNCI